MGGGGLGVSAFTLIFMFFTRWGGGEFLLLLNCYIFVRDGEGEGRVLLLSIGIICDLEQEWIYMRGGGGISFDHSFKLIFRNLIWVYWFQPLIQAHF